MQNIVEFEPSQRTRVHWDTLVFVGIFHVLAVAALFTFSWSNLAAAFVCWWVAASWGVGIGYHRLMTHRGFKTSKWMERVMATCATLAVQSGPIAWVTTHRIHHAFTDQERDPHSPRHGTYWSHIGWIFKGTAQRHSEVTQQRYSPDLTKDPYLRFIDQYYWVTSVVVGGILMLIGGWQMVLWGIFLRTVLGWHFTWLVNSATHLWGSQRFDTGDDSRNNGFVAALTFGEGWHNNHHAIPRSAKHGLTWREFDVNWVQIRLMERLGLVRDVYGYDLATEGKEFRAFKKAA